MSGPYRVGHRFLANARACSTNSRAAGESAVRDRHARPIVRLAAGAITNFESTEADNLYFATSCQFLSYCVKYSFYCFFSIFFS